LRLFTKKYGGIEIYRRLLPSLLIKPFKNSLTLLRRGLNLEIPKE
jgi:hypothetical protein